MIYAILDKTIDKIYFTDTPRKEEELDNTELLYTSDSKTLDTIKQDLRPWICLKVNSGVYYHNVPEIKDYMMDNITVGRYTKIYPSEVKSELERFIKDYTLLTRVGCIESTKVSPTDIDDLLKIITYDCDVYNLLSEVYGRENTDLVYSYKSLGVSEKTLLQDFIKQGTRDKKLQYLEKNIGGLNPEVLDFLPGWYRISLKTLGYRTSRKDLEYKNQEALGGKEEPEHEKIRTKFFDIFKLGKTYTGQEVKEMIQDVYKSLGITRTPKISDLFEFFEVTSVSQKSSYRIDLKK